ncbi:MAG: hypothetical protein ACRECO_02195 [Xanthobacteraceae bacterium]
MSERESNLRSVLMSYFPMFIAVLSLVTSIFNGYLNSRFVDIIQRNLGRGEYLRTCKEVIDAYFQVKLRADIISRDRNNAGAGGALTPQQIAGASAVARMAALGTYLANLRDDSIRERYTELSAAVEKALNDARKTPPEGVPKLFETADRIFSSMNADCVNSAKDRPM